MSVAWSKGSDGVLLVQPLQGVAPDLKVQEPNSELDARERICRPPEVSSRGGRTRPLLLPVECALG